MNKPKIYYDYVNFSLKEIPFFKDGWSVNKDINNTVKEQILNNKKTSNFFFIEKFNPGHISVSPDENKGIAKERIAYLKSLEEANTWLREIIKFIIENDNDSIIIIAADHAGFVGFNNSLESIAKIEDRKLLESIFGAKLAIKWNNSPSQEMDNRLKSSVNLFRILFSHLSEDKSLLENLQSDKSYNQLKEKIDGKNYYEVNFN
jgi:hypothetical protein